MAKFMLKLDFIFTFSKKAHQLFLYRATNVVLILINPWPQNYDYDFALLTGSVHLYLFLT